ncbi:unnamed protein product [Taenia asiatica]|uniref:Glycerate 3-kinase n=1 Tax=Taenia asiatica TaxID=60517 RepID=A0A0R3WFY2_TAEAS|nr:unnamed protein product [Taenia asiatica]
MALLKMKETTEAYLSEKVVDVACTVSIYINNNQQQTTRDAGELAGLNVLQNVNEPTTAAIAYGLDKGSALQGNVLVFGLGGETFNVH